MNYSGANIIRLLPAIAAFGFASIAQGNAEEQPRSPVVIELFSSQSCSACITAAEYFRELALRDDIVALGWHVDYWNLLNTKQGRWEDPYSRKEHTDRQKKYNINIRKRSSIYTPQMVVNGVSETVGSSREKVGPLIKNAQTERTAPVINANRKDGDIIFTVAESRSGGNAFLVTFERSVKTEIKGGENAGMDFLDTNVVTNVERLGVVRRAGATFSTASPPPGQGCALLIQEPKQGRIAAAHYCTAR